VGIEPDRVERIRPDCAPSTLPLQTWWTKSGSNRRNLWLAKPALYQLSYWPKTSMELPPRVRLGPAPWKSAMQSSHPGSFSPLAPRTGVAPVLRGRQPLVIARRPTGCFYLGAAAHTLLLTMQGSSCWSYSSFLFWLARQDFNLQHAALTVRSPSVRRRANVFP
jgi:hypothetical protein